METIILAAKSFGVRPSKEEKEPNLSFGIAAWLCYRTALVLC